MGWLDDIKRMYFFRCPACGHDFYVVGNSIDLDNTSNIKCEKCNTPGPAYEGFETVDEINLTNRVKRSSYTQNGRKAVRIGNTHMSMTKYNYLESGKVKNEYTPEYEAKLRQDEEKNAYLLETETNKRRAAVSYYRDQANKKSGSKTKITN